MPSVFEATLSRIGAKIVREQRRRRLAQNLGLVNLLHVASIRWLAWLKKEHEPMWTWLSKWADPKAGSSINGLTQKACFGCRLPVALPPHLIK